MKRIEVRLYTRDNCTLCKEAFYLLKWLESEYPLEIIRIEITSDPELELRYAIEIPVVEVEGEIISIGEVNESLLRERFQTLLVKSQ